MSSFAGRTLRATAAVAGIAAASAGVASPAFAAPAEPERPSADETAPAPAPDAAASPNVLGDLGKPGSGELPKLFTIDDTSVYTADDTLPTLPTAEELPQTDEVVNLGDRRQTEGTDVQFQAASAPRDSALQQLDAAALFGAAPEQLMGSTEGNEIHT